MNKIFFYVLFVTISVGCGRPQDNLINSAAKKNSEQSSYSSTERDLSKNESDVCQYGHSEKDFKFVGEKDDALCMVIVTSKSCSIGGTWTGITERVSYEDCGLWFDI